MLFARRSEPSETTGHDLAQQHSVMRDAHTIERSELVKRHAQDRVALQEDLEAREVTVVERLNDLDEELASILTTKEALR